MKSCMGGGFGWFVLFICIVCGGLVINSITMPPQCFSGIALRKHTLQQNSDIIFLFYHCRYIVYYTEMS